MLLCNEARNFLTTKSIFQVKRVYMIIFLNGTSSSGKSSIAREIQRQSEIPFLLYSIDMLLLQQIDSKFLSIDADQPPEWKQEWFYYTKQESGSGDVVIKPLDGKKAKQLHFDFIDSIGHLAQKGYSIIIDEVLKSKAAFIHYTEVLRGVSPIYLVKVICEDNERKKREKERGDRWVGISDGFLSSYDFIPNYHIILDTTIISPSQNAANLLSFMRESSVL